MCHCDKVDLHVFDKNDSSLVRSGILKSTVKDIVNHANKVLKVAKSSIFFLVLPNSAKTLKVLYFFDVECLYDNT